jgi:hypothetical protein
LDTNISVRIIFLILELFFTSPCQRPFISSNPEHVFVLKNDPLSKWEHDRRETIRLVDEVDNNAKKKTQRLRVLLAEEQVSQQVLVQLYVTL